MNDSLSTRGFVATTPNHLVTSEGLPITTFRLATTRRKFNRTTKSWENGDPYSTCRASRVTSLGESL
ncbi:hypothetical protein [Leifsonia sp. NPDC058248]|uniref:hypothetical protein n=1 Tax=Leifsonia sp. NPDC058248 TaxID=3346402 RepID=UPI0036DBA94A